MVSISVYGKTNKTNNNCKTKKKSWKI